MINEIRTFDFGDNPDILDPDSTISSIYDLDQRLSDVVIIEDLLTGKDCLDLLGLVITRFGGKVV